MNGRRFELRFIARFLVVMESLRFPVFGVEFTKIDGRVSRWFDSDFRLNAVLRPVGYVFRRAHDHAQFVAVTNGE